MGATRIKSVLFLAAALLIALAAGAYVAALALGDIRTTSFHAHLNIAEPTPTPTSAPVTVPVFSPTPAVTGTQQLATSPGVVIPPTPQSTPASTTSATPPANDSFTLSIGMSGRTADVFALVLLGLALTYATTQTALYRRRARQKPPPPAGTGTGTGTGEGAGRGPSPS